MKKNIILGSLLTGLIGLTACTNDEEVYKYIPDPNLKVLGQWQLVEAHGDTAFDFNEDGVESTDLVSETNCYLNNFLNFYANNTGFEITNSFAKIIVFPDFPETAPASIECVDEETEKEFTYVVQGNQVAMVFSAVGENEEMSRVGTIDGDTIRINIPAGQVYRDEENNPILTENLELKYVKIQ